MFSWIGWGDNNSEKYDVAMILEKLNNTGLIEIDISVVNKTNDYEIVVGDLNISISKDKTMTEFLETCFKFYLNTLPNINIRKVEVVDVYNNKIYVRLIDKQSKLYVSNFDSYRLSRTELNESLRKLSTKLEHYEFNHLVYTIISSGVRLYKKEEEERNNE